jgi:glycosyltransferase involved in cell wall biosynthesis
LKITFVLPEASLSGGVRVVAIYAQRLKQRGHNVTVVSTPPKPPPLREALRRVVKRGEWPLRRAGPSHMDGAQVEHRVLERYRPVTDRDVSDGDVVVATWWETAEWVAGLSPSKGAKVYLIQHDERSMYPAPESAAIRARVAATWHLPMHRVVVAQWLKALLEDRLGTGAARLAPNGVDLEQFHAPVRGKQETPTVGVMYATVWFKGCDVSLEAFRAAQREVPELRLLTFGSEAVAEHLPLPAGAEFVQSPPQATIREIYASCDAWLFGSRNEGFGLPLLEAMACRTPVIATPAGAAPEILAEGGGELVPYQDSEAMAEAMIRFARMGEEEWRVLSGRAYETACWRDWEHATDLFEAALHDAASRGIPAGSDERDVVRS